MNSIAKKVTKAVALAPVAPIFYAGREVVRLGQSLKEMGQAIVQTIDSNRPVRERGSQHPLVIAARKIDDLTARFQYMKQRQGWTEEFIAAYARYQKRTQVALLGLAWAFFCLTLPFSYSAAADGDLFVGVTWLAMCLLGFGLFFVQSIKHAKLCAAFETQSFYRFREFRRLPDFWLRLFGVNVLRTQG